MAIVFKLVFIAGAGAALAAADSPAGEQRWSVQTSGGVSEQLGTFGANGTTFYTADLAGNLIKWDTTAITKAGAPSKMWKYTVPASDQVHEDCDRGINSKPVLDSAETGIVFGTGIPPQYCVATSGFYKVDAATGNELWNFQLTDFVWTSAAMAMNDTVVYAVAKDAFGSGDGRMYAFDFATGEELWLTEVLGSEVFFPAFLDTPIVGEDGSAYLASENTAVYVINKDGERIFNYTTGSTGSTVGMPLLAVDEANGRLLVTTQDQSANFKQQAFDLSDGGSKFAELWAVEPDRKEIGYSGNRLPAVTNGGAGGDVVVAFLGDYLFGLDGASGDELWRFYATGAQAKATGNVPPLLNTEGTSVFVCSYDNSFTNFTSLNIQDGSVNWNSPYKNPYSAQCFGFEAATDATAGALVYCVEASTIRVFAADGGEEQWHVDSYGYTPLLDHTKGAAKCDGGYHMCTDYGPPS